MSKKTSFEKRAFSTAEAAAYIGRSKSYLEHGRSDGALQGQTPPSPPFIKAGRSVIYLREDLDQWLEAFPKLNHLAEVDKTEE